MITETPVKPYSPSCTDEKFNALLDEYGLAAQKVAQLREAYFLLKDTIGINHVATKAAWDVYIDRDACLQPLSTKISQMSMRRQMDMMDESEFETFHRNND